MIETITKETFSYGQHPWRTVINITTRDNANESASQIADRILDALCKKEVLETRLEKDHQIIVSANVEIYELHKKLDAIRESVKITVEEDGFLRPPEECVEEIEKIILNGKKFYQLEAELENDPSVPNYCPHCDFHYSEGGNCRCGTAIGVSEFKVEGEDA